LERTHLPFCKWIARRKRQNSISPLSQIISTAGAPLAHEPCQPNFLIIATSEPDRVLEAWYTRNNQLFGNASLPQIRHFLDTSRSCSVRVWQIAERVFREMIAREADGRSHRAVDQD
jgi:hypothetical protein